MFARDRVVDEISQTQHDEQWRADPESVARSLAALAQDIGNCETEAERQEDDAGAQRRLERASQGFRWQRRRCQPTLNHQLPFFVLQLPSLVIQVHPPERDANPHHDCDDRNEVSHLSPSPTATPSYTPNETTPGPSGFTRRD